MTTNYTPEEIKVIFEAPMMAGMAVSIADLGIVSTAIEAVAMAKEMAGAAKKYPNNTIIQSIFSEESVKNGQLKIEKPEITAEESTSDALAAKATSSISQALAILAGKATDEEIGQYKEFIYTCADVVANAAGSGLFGSGNPKVSDKEMVVLNTIKTTLGV